MAGVIFRETLRRTWWQMLYWGVGLGAMAFIASWLVPLFDITQLRDVLQNVPPVMLAAIGLDENMTALATPDGIIAVGFFGKFALVFAAYPVVMGMRITANEEDDGIMDVLLSLPVARWRLLLEKFAAYTLTIVLIGLIVYLALGAGSRISGVTLDMGRMAGAVLNLVPMLLLVLAFTMLVGTVARRRQVALGIVTGFVLGSYVLYTFASMVKGGISTLLNAVSFFSYFDVNAVALHGANLAHIAVLLVAAVLLVIGSLWQFQRRDVGL